MAWLAKCLAAVTDPENPIALVAVLRGELFGVSDTAFYAFRKAGGRFDYRTEIPAAGMDAAHMALFKDAFARLQRYALWFKRLPAIAAIERIAADLGLPMRAAAAVGGNGYAGSLAKALETLRAAQAELYSTADLVAHLDRLINENHEFDGLPARPHDASAVRLMNLHKVKGLESPVVFLSAPAGKFEHDVDLHINRAGSVIQGYMTVYGPQVGQQRPILACPLDPEPLFAEEKKYQRAEDHRLLYVAATRAGGALVVVQRAKGNNQNPWSDFAPFLHGCAELTDPGPQSCPLGQEVVVTAPDVAEAIEDVIARWDQTARPSYATAAAKEMSLVPSRIHFHSATGEHGTEWGTVIHLLLETALVRPGADLHQLARLALADEGLAVGQADEAVEMVEKVLKSDILRRAKAASRYLVEVPFQKLVPANAPQALRGLPTIVRGVIDLAFYEPSGWVIVDYKTDRIAFGHVPAAVEHYRAQVTTYADAWQEIVGQSIHERGLYFTHLNAYARV